jgi:hypothetical protein
MKRITVTIDPLGNAKVAASGFTGKECDVATKGIEAALAGPGGAVTKEYKPEANMGGSTTQTQQTQRW